MFDSHELLEDHDLRIKKQKLSNLSLITLTSYVVFSCVLICETSLRVYISIDGYLDKCEDKGTCMVLNKSSDQGHEIRPGCSAIAEEDNVTFLHCYKVSYKLNEALASAGGLFTIAKLIPQVVYTVISSTMYFFLRINHSSMLLTLIDTFESYTNTVLQFLFKLLMFVYNFAIIPLLYVTMHGHPTRVEQKTDEFFSYINEEMWIFMSIVAIATVMMNNSSQYEAALLRDSLKNSSHQYCRSEQRKESTL